MYRKIEAHALITTGGGWIRYTSTFVSFKKSLAMESAARACTS